MPTGHEPSQPPSARQRPLTAAQPATADEPALPAPGSGAPTVPPAPDGAGAQRPNVPGYEILGELGRGAMGVVYQAQQVRLKRLAALKMILAGAYAGEHERARFRTEAEAVARLQHPNIVQVHEVGEVDGRPFISLEFVAGSSLAGQLDGTPWPAPPAARLVETLARAVEHAHQRGIVHRDLKPANILLVLSGRSTSTHRRLPISAWPRS
jgi:serine/threonine-protein kinase